MKEKINGRCYCGTINFELLKKPGFVVNCHCDECKKRNGSVFSTYLVVPAKALRICSGEDSLKCYEEPGKGKKYFCEQCGSPLYNDNYRFPRMYMLFSGVIDGAENFIPDANVYCEKKYDWVDGIGLIKSYLQGIE